MPNLVFYLEQTKKAGKPDFIWYFITGFSRVDGYTVTLIVSWGYEAFNGRFQVCRKAH